MARDVAAVVERFGGSVTEGLETAGFLRDWAERSTYDYAFDLQPLDHLAQPIRVGPTGVRSAGAGRSARDARRGRGLVPGDESATTNHGPRSVSLPSFWRNAQTVPSDHRHAVRGAAHALRPGEAIGQGAAVRTEHAARRRSCGPCSRVTTPGRRSCTAYTSRDVPSGLSRWARTVPVQRAVRALMSDEPRTLLVQSHDIDIALGRCAVLAVTAEIGLVGARVPPDDRNAIDLLAAHAAARSRSSLRRR